MIKRCRKTESEAYNSALNEVRYDVEHDFKPLNLSKGWYIGLDDVYYDYDELSATVFVLDDKDKVVDEEEVSIPVDVMKDYTTGEMRKLEDLMLEKINEVADNLKDSYEVYLSQRRSESKDFNRVRTESENREFDTFIKRLMSILNSTFSDKGKWYLSEDRFGKTVIEHEGGVKFTFRDFRTYCPPSVPCNNPWDLSVSVTYPNGKTQHIDHYLKENDVIDIADKMYELAVVKYRNEGRVRTEANHYWLDRFSKHEGLKEIIDSCTDKEKEELNTAITEIMNAANDLKEGHSLSAFLDCLLAGNNMTKLANKLKRKQVWYTWH